MDLKIYVRRSSSCGFSWSSGRGVWRSDCKGVTASRGDVVSACKYIQLKTTTKRNFQCTGSLYTVQVSYTSAFIMEPSFDGDGFCCEHSIIGIMFYWLSPVEWPVEPTKNQWSRNRVCASCTEFITWLKPHWVLNQWTDTVIIFAPPIQSVQTVNSEVDRMTSDSRHFCREVHFLYLQKNSTIITFQG